MNRRSGKGIVASQLVCVAMRVTQCNNVLLKSSIFTTEVQ